jgi:hypothetical protein
MVDVTISSVPVRREMFATFRSYMAMSGTPAPLVGG